MRRPIKVATSQPLQRRRRVRSIKRVGDSLELAFAPYRSVGNTLSTASASCGTIHLPTSGFISVGILSESCFHVVAHAEFQLPAATTTRADTPQFQQAEFCDFGMELYGNIVVIQRLIFGERRFQGIGF